MSDPFKITEPTVISFSGGRTSAYMLWRILQSNNGLPENAIVCFANTGKEEDATLQFVHDCETKWNVKIHWIEYQWAEETKDRFKVVDFETASREGEPFEEVIKSRNYLPNPVSRFCTVELKVRAIHRYLKSIGWTEWNSFIGIRSDEQRRLAKIKNQDYGKYEEKYAPLGEANVTKEIVGEFWAKNDFDLGLPNMNGVTMHGNCDLCFLKGAKQTMSLIQEKPERATWWAKMESLALSSKPSGARFRKDRPSYAEMQKFANTQTSMFDFDDETIPCFCGE